MPELLSYDSWVEIPNPNSEAWIDYDLNNAGCPADTIGVICYYLREQTTSGSESVKMGIRPNGSTDADSSMYQVYARTSDADWKRNLQMCGCDGNQLIEAYQSNVSNAGSGRLVIIGWIKAGEAYMLTNGVNYTQTGGSGAGSWNEVHFDSAIQGGDTPQAWMVKVANKHWNADSLQPRPAGSTYNIFTSYQYSNQMDFITGVGTNNRLDVWLDDTSNFRIMVRGYFLTGYTDLHDSPVSYAPGSSGSWQTVSVSAIPADAIAIFQSDSDASGDRLGVREVGSADDDYPEIGPGPVVHIASVGPNSQVQVFKRYNPPCLITGYFEGSLPEIILESKDLTNTGVVQPQPITHHHALAERDLANTTSIKAEAITQYHTLAKRDLTHLTSIESGEIDLTHDLESKDLTHVNLIESGEIGQSYDTLNARDLNGPTEIEAVPITQIIPHDLESTPGIDNTTQVQGRGVQQDHQLGSSLLWGYNEIQSGAIAQDSQINAKDLTQVNTIQRAAIVQTHDTLAARDINAVHATQSAKIGYDHVLETLDVTNETFIQAGAVDTESLLLAYDLDSVGEVEGGAIATAHDTLASRDLNGINAIQRAGLTQEHPLVADDLGQSNDIQSGTVATEHILGARHLDTVGLLEGGDVVMVYALAGRDLYQEFNYIQEDAIEKNRGISAVFDTDTGILPLYWPREVTIMGYFGSVQGQVDFGDVPGVVHTWSTNRITATPVQDGRPNGEYMVSVYEEAS